MRIFKGILALVLVILLYGAIQEAISYLLFLSLEQIDKNNVTFIRWFISSVVTIYPMFILPVIYILIAVLSGIIKYLNSPRTVVISTILFTITSIVQYSFLFYKIYPLQVDWSEVEDFSDIIAPTLTTLLAIALYIEIILTFILPSWAISIYYRSERYKWEGWNGNNVLRFIH